MQPERRLPRELVLASAGSGKTFRISSRFIGLLARDVPPDEILAATFTRKAAGQILDRILCRLATAALDPREARELAGHALPGRDPDLLAQERCSELLQRLTGSLHRLNVETLDAFFVRTARSFFLELQLPPGWGMADYADEEELRAGALQVVLDEADPGILVELLRMMHRGEVVRSVHGRLLRDISGLHRIHQEVDPEAPDPWSLPLGGEADEPWAADPDRREALAERIRAQEAPPNRDGTPRKTWIRALEDAAAAVEEGRWVEALAKGIGKCVLTKRTEYGRVPIPAPLEEVFREVIREARGATAGPLRSQLRALGRLAALYDRAYAGVQRRRRLYRFEDLTRLLGGDAPPLSRSDLFFRIDARIRHVLLDEFQDTSLAQWRAIVPLVDELLSGDEGDRAGVIVADPKQSIYGWRGAVPELVHHVGERYALEEEHLQEIWRSSPVVLGVVNRIFSGLGESPVLEGEDPRVVSEWLSSYVEHRAAAHLADAPGHVRIAVGPEEEGRGSLRPRLLARGAEIVAGIVQECPDRSVGVLTRTNDAVAHLIHELSRLGVDASEEGGKPLVDAAPVSAILALLRLADHPGDRVARYHVSRTPLGVLVGFRAHDSDGAAHALAHRVRTDLLQDGYGPSIRRWVEGLAPSVDGRELRRLCQLVELAHRFEGRARLRPGDFVRLVRDLRVEDPTGARVRVMTVHQAKGLEFDVVVLPQLDASLVPRGGGGPLLPYRPSPTAPITRLFPRLDATHRLLFPESGEAWLELRARALRDGLSSLYVALTRARHALHLLLPPDGPRGEGDACSPARIVRNALVPGVPALAGDDDLFALGEPHWYRSAAMPGGPSPSPVPETPAGPVPLPVLRSPSPRTRNLARRRASDLEGAGRTDAARILDLGAGRARSEGILVHAWCEAIEWLDEGAPADGELVKLATRVAPGLAHAHVVDLLRRFRSWLEGPDVRRVMSRGAYPPGTVVERELPILHREEGIVVEGVADRVVLVPGRGGEPGRAQVIDFKSDAPEGAPALDARVEHYRPQLEAYRRGVAFLNALPLERVSAVLVFLSLGNVREI